MVGFHHTSAPQSSLQAAQSALGQPRFGNRFAQLSKNVGKLAVHGFDEFVHNPIAFRSDALILSSLLLVTSRIAIANLTAARAKTPEEKHYRGFEAIKTTMREALGWTFSFGVLRQLNIWLSGWMNKHYFGVELTNLAQSKSGEAFRRIPKQIGQFFRGQVPTIHDAEAFLKPTVHLNMPTGLNYLPDLLVNDGAAKWRGEVASRSGVSKAYAKTRLWLNERKFTMAKALRENGRNVLEKAHNWSIFRVAGAEASKVNVVRAMPLVLSAIPTILLSGVFLEWFSNMHARNIASFMTERVMDLHKEHPSHESYLTPTTPNPFVADARKATSAQNPFASVAQPSDTISSPTRLNPFQSSGLTFNRGLLQPVLLPASGH